MLRLPLFALMVGFASIVAASAQEPAPSVMKQCGDKWQAAKAAGTTGDVTWTQFLSGCRADMAAQPASAATAPAPAAAPTNQQPGAVAAAPPAPSFDCSTAKSGAARLICSDAELSKADADLGKAFHASLARLEGAEKSAAIKDQVHWIHVRNTRCELSGKENASIEELAGAKGCMLQAMQSRIQYFGGANFPATPASAATAPPPAPLPAATPKALADGSAALKRKDYPTALQLLQPLADQGDPNAQELVGEMNEHGWGIAADGAEALKWYRKAADQGDVLAQNSLGFLYLTGSGVTKNGAEALKWYRKAADQGNAEAQFNLGQIYGSGDAGAAKDTTEAAKWHRKAADQGYAFAQYFLGVDYAEGRGMPKDDAEALKWYRKAADQGLTAAKAALAQLTADEATKNAVAAPSPNDFSKVKVTQFLCHEGFGDQSILRIDSNSVDDAWVSTREALETFGAFSVNLLYAKCNGNPGRSRIIIVEGTNQNCNGICRFLSLENRESLRRWGLMPPGVKYTFKGEEWYAADQENVYWQQEKEKIARQQLIEQQKLESERAQHLRATVNNKQDIAGFTTGVTIESISEARNCTQQQVNDNTITYHCPSGEMTAILAEYLNPRVIAIILLEFCDPKQGPAVAADVAQQFGIVQFPWILHTLGPSAEGHLDSDKHLALIPANMLSSLAPGQASSINCPVNFNLYSLELIDDGVIRNNTKAKMDHDQLLTSTPTQKF
ncbi:MAG: lysozyme inhibitor LprI family protein [Roseiarcus sp.]